MDRLTVNVEWAALVGGSGGPRVGQKPRVFVAYRFNSAPSRTMYESLKRASETSAEFSILDGHVEEGRAWATEVRDRIKKSRLVIADVTGPSRDVMFELGFAGNKAVLPLVHRATDRDEIPLWITGDQLAAYEGSGLATLTERVRQRLTGVSRRGANRPPPVPGEVVWLQAHESTWANVSQEHFRNLAREQGLEVMVVAPEDLYSPEDLRRYLRAWLVVGCVDGGAHDYAAHFFFGDVVGRQDAGSGKVRGAQIRRLAIALAPDDESMRLHLADSVKRVTRENIALAVKDTDLVSRAQKAFKTYRSWRAESHGGIAGL